MKCRRVESGVWDDSACDKAGFGCEGESEELEAILKIISNGSFPKPGARDNLTAPERTQLRDAMIFCAHVRAHRDIFVTNDTTAFIKHGRKSRFEIRYATRLMTRAEFEQYLGSLGAI